MTKLRERTAKLAAPASKEDRVEAIRRALTVLILSAVALVVLGVIMVFSATAPSSIGMVDADPTRQLFASAIRQTIWAIVGIAGGIILAHIPYTVIRRVADFLLALGMVLQALVLATGGEGVGGNNNWLSLGPVSLQPSEFLKLAMIIWLAKTLAKLPLQSLEDLRALAIPAAGFAVSIGLVLAGKDLGTGLVFTLIAVGMFWLAGMRGKHIFWALVIASFGAAILVALNPSRLTRVFDYFKNLLILPDIHEPTQGDFAQFAFGTGGLWGAGLGAGKEKWRDLAEAHTDFIFAVIGEELGLFGVLTVIALFLALGWSLVQLCINQPNRYAQLLTAGAGLWLCGQAFANMFVVTGLLPIFGVPLPFVSMGGSSMMSSLFMLGCVVACARAVPGVPESLKNRSNIANRALAVIRRK
ncbi:MAG: FtsW/RodA/SpoVE family cell cycle protein [Trueperella sp.]|nr:FtsW/RodA/SpoVE family cell cycle protein [Trueperella sp.]